MSGLRHSSGLTNLVADTLRFRDLSGGLLTLSEKGVVRNDSSPALQNLTVSGQSYLSNTTVFGTLRANSVNALISITSPYAAISRLDVSSASIDSLHVSSAFIGFLDASNAQISFLDVSSAVIGGLDASAAYIEYLDVSNAHIGVLDASSASIRYLDASSAQIGTLDAYSASIGFLDVSSAQIGTLDASSASIRYLDASSAQIGILDASSASIGFLDVSNVTVRNNLDALSAFISTLDISNAIVRNHLDASSAFIGYLDVSNADIYQCNISSAAIAYMDASNAMIEGTLTVGNLDVSNINVDLDLTAKNASIENLTATKTNFPPNIFNHTINGISTQLTPYTLNGSGLITKTLANPPNPGLFCIMIDVNNATLPISVMAFFNGNRWSYGGFNQYRELYSSGPKQGLEKIAMLIFPEGSGYNLGILIVSDENTESITGNIAMIPIFVAPPIISN